MIDLGIFKDYFYFNIPLGVVLLIVFSVVRLYNNLLKKTENRFDKQMSNYRLDIQEKNARITELETRLYGKKGGKK